MRVVLVEDDVRMQRELRHIVAAMPGAEVVFMADAANPAIQWVQDHPAAWDLAIVDIFLKHGHGFDVLRACAKHKLPGQHAVMLSNYGREPVACYARAAGADRFFDKAFQLEELIAYCRALPHGSGA